MLELTSLTVVQIVEMDYVNNYLKVSPFTANQSPENELAYEKLMDVRLKLVDLSYEIDRNHDAYMRFMQQTLNSPDLKSKICKVTHCYSIIPYKPPSGNFSYFTRRNSKSSVF